MICCKNGKVYIVAFHCRKIYTTVAALPNVIVFVKSFTIERYLKIAYIFFDIYLLKIKRLLKLI